MLALKNVNGGKEESVHTFLAGLFGGYWVFGHGRSANSSVNQQIVIYVFAQVVLATAKLAVQPPGDNSLVAGSYGGRGGKGLLGLSGQQLEAVRRNSWPVFASLSWASVMWLFRYYPETLQPSLRSSMTYMYVSGFVALFSFVGSLSSFTDLGLTRHFLCVDTQTRKNGMGREISFGTTSDLLMHSEALLETHLVYTVISGTRKSNAVYDLDVLQSLTKFISVSRTRSTGVTCALSYTPTVSQLSRACLRSSTRGLLSLRSW